VTAPPEPAAPPPPGRGVYCNRTLNLESIRAVGYDMDYTLVHYDVGAWERRAYDAVRARLIARGWPLDPLGFEPERVIRGLTIDIELGNLVKANRFGYVKRAVHGGRVLDHEETRAAYAREVVSFDARRFRFLNTLFSLSEGCLFAQLVELLDAGRLPRAVGGYEDLWRELNRALDAAHVEGELKVEIAADPARFVVDDPHVPQVLRDQRAAGKKVLLITNSEWVYADAILEHALGRHLPPGETWRDLFDVAIVEARKPRFFSDREAPLFEVVSKDGLLRPTRRFAPGGAYLGGCAAQVEAHLGLAGEQVLYVGDHLFSDVHASKSVLRWRTALVLRELEEELADLEAFRPRQRQLQALMGEKEALEARLAAARLAAARAGREPAEEELAEARAGLAALDARIAPLARAAGELGNPTWGPLLRTGRDKSLLARQVERHADVYTSRVSNLLGPTPYAYLRSVRGTLPSDPP